MENLANYINESIEVKQAFKDNNIEELQKIIDLTANSLENGKKILVAGNGGSAADAQHFAAELVGRYKKERTALPAIALTTDSSNLTAIGNDYGYDAIFKRQVEALAQVEDILFVISTSGNSSNLLETIDIARNKGVKIVGLLGKDGGKLKQMCDYSIVVPSNNTPRIQENHIFTIHCICEEVENSLFSS